MKKLQVYQVVFLFVLTFTIGCKKESQLPDLDNRNPIINSNSGGINIFTGSSQNPYAISNIRFVKSIFSTLSDPFAQQLGAAAMDPNAKWLYIRLNPTTEIHYTAVESMIAADTAIHLFNHPLDTPTYITSTWEDFSEANFKNQFYNDDYLYTVIRVSSTVRPGNVPYTILDTLYIPNDDEPYLDFFAHMVTNNIDNQTMFIIENEYPDLYEILLENDSQLVHVSPKYLDKYKTNSIFSGAFNSVFGGLSSIFNGASNLFGWGVQPSGYLYVYDDAQGANVPVMGCRVDAIHWGKTVSGWTDVFGHFQINRRFLFGSLITMVYDNGLCKIKQFDTHSGWVATVPVQWVLNAATHISGFYSASQMANLSKTYTAHTQVRFWSMITNGAFESYFMNIAKGITINAGRITIFAHWADNSGGASAAMLGYLGSINSGMELVLLKLGAPSLSTSPKPRLFWGYLPDVTIRMDATPAVDEDYHKFGISKSTLYHELAHVSHYFKVGNSFWIENINHVLAANPGYGGNPSTDAHSEFFCLTEGWAEYIGQLYASMRYPGFSFQHSYYKGGSVSGIYLTHLENGETFNNEYIPKGLFYDLTDEEPGVGNDETIYDKLDNYTTGQMFQCLNSQTDNIPDFKARLVSLWGGNQSHLNDLFDEYGF
ncbi:MAG: hypothetical protein KBB37_01785 [Bacteroidia bacterium]|nr:hypothetical protein [Bacteroidia bacterium]MBP7259989.1 hypothetical protein [Bacteroidia bacterium]MBP9179696.1 hypothetical protein [Bacteroidia bacterium]MBP9723905.1 hypothetical protein [Bacteroidia bacterium]